ncbi:hypothetical protein ACFQJD_09870 [Haloplanus sp. GCM10025708]|uniref:hypothetical protein n=1 Tax=Haloferacaceae TaxID=1644056 RepID=UPI003615BAB6
MTALEADLTLERGDDEFSIDGDGRTVVVDAPSLAAAARLRPTVARLRTAAAAAPFSKPTPRVTVDVRVRGASVARAGPDVSPGVASSLLGVAPVRVSASGVVRAAVRAWR